MHATAGPAMLIDQTPHQKYFFYTLYTGYRFSSRGQAGTRSLLCNEVQAPAPVHSIRSGHPSDQSLGRFSLCSYARPLE